jgi:tRNA pseudouridine38-40 synthase
LLPEDIRVLSARRVPASFHARLSARSKVYRYQIYRGSVLPPHHVREHYHYPYPLDLGLLERAARMFEGEHDFASFAARSGEKKDRRDEVGRVSNGTPGGSGNGEAARNTIRYISSCRLDLRGKRLIFQVEGNGFLHHMVRNMIGTLLEVGRGRISLRRFEELLRTRDRTRAGFTAPAHGLILVRVRY